MSEPVRRSGPFIMPDGRPLLHFIDTQQQQVRPGRGTYVKPHRPGKLREPRDGWTKVPRAAAGGGGGGSGVGGSSGGQQTEAEQAELSALSRVGQRKQRRWLNDKLLRDMAGALTAAEMASLFKPVPFGAPRGSSPWELAAQPEHAVLWDLFRSLDMDKQSRVLQKWEAHVRELQAGPAAIRSPAVDAIAAWAGVSTRARQAMKRSSPEVVQALEDLVLAFLQQDEQQEQEEAGEEQQQQQPDVDGGSGGISSSSSQGGDLVLFLDEGFHRLIAHGLAEYHGLASHSRVLPGGGKAVVIRRRRPASDNGAAATVAPAAAAAVSAAVEASEGGEDSAPLEPHPQQTRQHLAITCSDLLHILLEEQQPLNTALLHQALCQPVDSSSEAGDAREAAGGAPMATQQQQQQQPVQPSSPQLQPLMEVAVA